MISSTFGQDYWREALRYWRDPAQKSWILVNPASMGDTFCTLALARAFRETHDGAPLTVVVRQSQADLAELFVKDLCRTIVWEDERLVRFCLRLRGCGHFDIDEPIIAHCAWHGTARNLFPLFERLRQPGKGGLTFADQWRLMLRMDWNTTMTVPNIPATWREAAEIYADEVGVVRGRSVILFPDNNTNPALPDRVWERLVAALNRRNVKVFVNMHGNWNGERIQTLKGAHPIQINLRNAVPLVEAAGRFITMANGMQTYLIGSNVKAQHSFLLHDWGPGVDLGRLGYEVKDPMAVQTFTAVGVGGNTFCEYVLPGDGGSDALIEAIADNDPAYRWS